LSPDSRNNFGLRTGSIILTTIRALAWIVVIGLIMASIVPAPLRPGTGASHNLEHFGSFLFAGIIWCLAYSGRLLLWLGTMFIFAGSVELLQILVPGRHARFSDFVVDVVGGCAGILVAFLVVGFYRFCRKSCRMVPCS
jgi:VanZ family protein